MHREKVVLPPLPLQEPISSSRITNFQDYAQWDKQRKQAYRQELKHEMEQHNQSRDNLLRQKELDRQQINAIVKSERQRNDEDRHLKIKTEQKYMHDNWSMLQHSHRNSPNQRNNPEDQSREHPFVKLVEQQDQRRQETKHNFIFQNKLNDMQTEMKRAQTIRRKQFEMQQRRLFDEHVQDQYRIKRKERDFFENKYLKIDKNSSIDCKKQYLQYLKAQADINRSHRRDRKVDCIQQINRASPGNIGLSPASFDRIKQLQTIEKSLKMFNNHKGARNNSTLDYSHRQDITLESHHKVPQYDKVVTERAAPVYYNSPSQSFETLQKSPIQTSRVPPIQSQLSERLQRPIRLPKSYKQYNIINGSERIFIN